MARMIPPVAHLGTKSEGEAHVFECLRDDTSTECWIVLHSYDLPVHATRFMGEIDFVVVVPRHGVLCLSVKDCASVTRDSAGVWRVGTHVPTAAGPFKAAREDMFSLRAKLIGSRPDLRHIPFAFAVLFTRVIPRGELRRWPNEWDPHEQIFADAFRSRSLPQLLLGSLDETVRKIDTTTAARIDPERFTEDDAGAILEALRPELEMYQSAKDRTRQTASELKRYTDEQLDALDAAECNARVLYEGLAGTGKTLLALESARRASARGQKTLLMCFNTLLGHWLRDQTGNTDGITVQTMHGLLYQLAGASYEDNSTPLFWTDLASEAMRRLIDNASDEFLYDVLILDEAQDLLRLEFVDLLDLILIGGLANGRWLMFGDTEQNIYGAARYNSENACDPIEYCFKHGSAAYRHPLRRNCRNTPRVAQYAELLGRLSPGYKGCRRPDDGLSPTIMFYRSPEEQSSTLRRKSCQSYAANALPLNVQANGFAIVWLK